MKCLVSLIILALFVLSSAAQSKPTTAADYKDMFEYAVSETNEAFPFIFTVVVDEFKSGKNVYSETMLNERQEAGVERITRTAVEEDHSNMNAPDQEGSMADGRPTSPNTASRRRASAGRR